MRSKISLVLVVASLFYLFNSTSSFAKETCVKVQVTGTECTAESIQVDLKGCEDALIGINNPRCNGDEMRFKVRARDQDYTIVMKKGEGAWGQAATWELISQKSIPHLTPNKTLPKTEHERTQAPTATIAVPAPNAATTAPNEPKVTSAFSFNAFFDAYYEANFNSPISPGSGLVPQNTLRFYDWYANQVNLSLAEFTAKYVRKETSFLLDLDFGQFADQNTLTATPNSSGNPTFSTADEITKHIGQAVLTYTPNGAPGFVFDIGKMPTHLGLELAKSKDNWNYTRTVMFSFGIPLWHNGLHVGYSLIPNQLTANVYLYNGWGNNVNPNLVPTYGAELKWVPNDRLTWVYNYIGGLAPSTLQWREVHESNFSYSLTPTLTLASDFLYGYQKYAATNGQDAKWYGAQFGLKWQTAPTYYISPRLEYYRDANGFTLGGDDQFIASYTLTNSYLVSEGLELRLEGRWDHSSLSNRFASRYGNTADQPTVLLGVLYNI